MKIHKIKRPGHENNVPVSEIAKHYLATIKRTKIKTLNFHPIGKSSNTAAGKFRFAVLEHLTNNRAWQYDTSAEKLQVATQAAIDAGYTIRETNPDDYNRKQYLATIKQEVNQ